MTVSIQRKSAQCTTILYKIARREKIFFCL